MSRGNAGGMLGVGGTRSNLSRAALRGGGRGGSAGGGADALTRKRELLRKLREGRSGAREE
ncbi:hypothetical protein CTZ27_06545 [Streptomyces griseocarneus]|nr:hypothetical protein CTZ27_06545 [Streptomyces griseocarneus]